MNHTQHIQALINEREYKHYLEIGVQAGHNIMALTGLTKSVGVDPANESSYKEGWPEIVGLTSDEYFDQLDGRTKFDLIFVDGLHHADQVERDIVNSWKHLKKGGALVLHDVWPTSREMTIIPRQQKQWTGDVFRAFDGLIQKYPDLKWELSKEDYGIATIWFDKDIKIEPGFVSDIDFDEYKLRYE